MTSFFVTENAALYLVVPAVEASGGDIMSGIRLVTNVYSSAAWVMIVSTIYCICVVFVLQERTMEGSMFHRYQSDSTALARYQQKREKYEHYSLAGRLFKYLAACERARGAVAIPPRGRSLADASARRAATSLTAFDCVCDALARSYHDRL